MNTSIWAVEDVANGGLPLQLVDTTTDETVALDPSIHATAIGVVVQFAPTEDLMPNRVYEIRNAHTAATQFTTGSDRDEVAPSAPSLRNGYAQFLNCSSTYGVAVFFDAEVDTLTFARRTDGTLLGFSEPAYPLTVAGDLDTEVEFRAYSVDLAGNASDDSATRREAISDPDEAMTGCTCAGAGRTGIAAGLLLLPLLFGRRRRMTRMSRRRS